MLLFHYSTVFATLAIILPSILVDIRKHSKVVVQDIALDIVMESVVTLLTEVARRLSSKTVVNRYKLGSVDQTHLAHVRTVLGLEHQSWVVGAVHVVIFLVGQSNVFILDGWLGRPCFKIAIEILS